MTSIELDMVAYAGNRAAAERQGLPLSGAGFSARAEYAAAKSTKDELKRPGGLVVHSNTSRAGEIYMLEEAAIRIQRAYRRRKKARLEAERRRSAITRDDPDALIDADMFDAAFKGDFHALRDMIARGASVNAMGAYGQYPLHYAIAGGNRKCVNLLLENLASVNVQDAKGDTPLHVAARNGDVEIIRALVKRRADRSACNYAGKTPRAVARRYGETLCMEALIYVPMSEEELKDRPDLLDKIGMDGSMLGDPEDNVEMTKISVQELEMLRRDLEQWRDTAKRHKAREARGETRPQLGAAVQQRSPPNTRSKGSWPRLRSTRRTLLRISLHKGAKDAINEAEGQARDVPAKAPGRVRLVSHQTANAGCRAWH